MSVCEKHGYDLRYIKECTGCVREERDRLRSQLDDAVRLLKRRMHCDICECHGCIEIRKVIEG